MMTLGRKLKGRIETRKGRSAWERGVRQYALDLLAKLDESEALGYIAEDDISNADLLETALLNGAQDWRQYSEGGCALVYDEDIANRLCNMTEYKKCKRGTLPPNKFEDWLDVQTRALGQAFRIIRIAYWDAKK